MRLYRDWSVFASSEKVSDPDGAKHLEGRYGHRGQTPFPQLLCCRGIAPFRSIDGDALFIHHATKRSVGIQIDRVRNELH